MTKGGRCRFASGLEAVTIGGIIAVAIGGLSMNEHRTALALFAVALAIAVVVASVTTLERVNTHKMSDNAAPGTTGLAKPHPPLDRAPGEPIPKER
jgi:hypothetical protein